jgi:hypothetical protein
VSEDRCPFNDTIMHGGFGCRNAQTVTRRAGPDIACSSVPDQARCSSLFERAKAAGLPALGYQDDLLSMPHSALLKIKFGSLLGAQRTLAPPSITADTVPDVAALVDAICEKFGGVESFPCESVTSDMAAYGIRRRSGRKP